MSNHSTPKMSTHRGFSTKVRGMLLDPPGSIPQEEQAKLNNLTESPGKAGTSLRKLIGLAKSIVRTDSESSQRSNSSTNSCPVKATEFDDFGRSTKQKDPRMHSLLGDIGRTKSASDIIRKNTIMRNCAEKSGIKPSPSFDSGPRPVSLEGSPIPPSPQPYEEEICVEMKTVSIGNNERETAL
ncbi:hypothetical protein QR680_003740 [Steinernema hermaphroditum]|uniref:Uncharacterized protein n=1 Tax=Steinernema hermaphroditum TaxID=289476 RepID=A0AA39HLE0_9BILA|nr:hypothetical protein QR680_003740 [Steinernema hermaphroditum]